MQNQPHLLHALQLPGQRFLAQGSHIGSDSR
jgi:hypothetical protein